MYQGMRLGLLVKRRRNALRLTQEQLAVEAFGDESKKTRISEIENGKVNNPHPRTIDPVMAVLGIEEEEVESCRQPSLPILPSAKYST